MTIETLRPDSTVASGWTLVGGANAHAVTSDNNDASYAAGANGAQLVLGLGSFTLPAGAVTKSVTPRWKARTISGGTVLTLVVTRPATTETSVGGATFLDASEVARSTAALGTTLTAGAGSPSPWAGDQTALNALTLTAIAPTGDTVRIAELYVDVEVVGQPTTAVVAPTGTVTDTTSVLVEWQHTPGDAGGPQAFFHVKVFNAAQFGTTGFDPATARSVFDSGVMVGSARSLRTTALTNGTQYRAYVRTAQSVNGRPHWAAWDGSFSTFTLDADAPTVASITAVGDSDRALVRLTVSRDTAGEPWDLLEVQRTDDAAVTWVPVRGATLTDPPGNMWIGYDVEAPNGLTVRYRARGVRTVGASQVAGDWVLSNTTSWSSPDPILKDLQFPANSRKVKLRDAGDPTLPVVQGVFNVLGKNRKVGISDVRTGEEGELVFRTSTFAEADDLMALLELPVLLLQLPVGWDVRSNLYFQPGSYQRPRLTPKVEGRAAKMRWFRVPYVEVDPPLDVGVEVPATTWEDLDDLGLTWDDMLDAGTTWGDLL